MQLSQKGEFTSTLVDAITRTSIQADDLAHEGKPRRKQIEKRTYKIWGEKH